MIQILNIENVALIDKATLNFKNGLNVISGETGAGKSILLDSLSFVFGGRADKSLIRSGKCSMKVEAIFSCENFDRINNACGTNFTDEIFISRELFLDGRNVCKINGDLVPVATVKKICSMLVDIHGQSEHLSILNNDYQLKIIDLFSGKAEEVLLKLNEKINEYRDFEKEIKILGGDETEKQNLVDLYSYQINEIENADIKENEFEELEEEKRKMQFHEKINNKLEDAYALLGDSGFDKSSIEKIYLAFKSIQEIESFDEVFVSISKRLNESYLELNDLFDTIKEKQNGNELNQERFDYVDNRLDYLKTLFRKYGGNYSSLIEYYEKVKKSLDLLLNSQEKYTEIKAKQEKVLEEIDKIQDELSTIRKNSAKILVENLSQELRLLGLPHAKIDIIFSKINEDFSTNGYDRVEYMFSSNLGFELKPLNKVVSGGEMSRVMLAYKIVVSKVDSISTIIFDEIDTGLSGNIALVVAEYMARLSTKKQIVAVSHLPQICAMADFNIKVEKHTVDNTTVTKSTVLEKDNLFKEIARLMGIAEGMNYSSAIELNKKCIEYKEKIKDK